MSKVLLRYACQDCGAIHPKWSGRCTACEAWNTLVEEVISSSSAKEERLKGRHSPSTLSFLSLKSESPPLQRLTTGVAEFDRVLGGGLVPGSVILIGGDPGIGKSTLMLQISAYLSQNPQGQGGCAYISGEEGPEQIRLRAQRLGLVDAPLLLANATQVQEIMNALDGADAPKFLILDSIQTLYVEGVEAAPGTVTQVRAATHEIIKIAKEKGITVFLIGHVTKEGTLAGPRLLEHMVDTVLYFEGERTHTYRILRTVKNRFGPTHEIGVFEMTDRGLGEITNPSQLFMGEGDRRVSGISLFAGIEGTRPLLVEIQALVTPTPFGTPRRTAVGWDYGRLCMILAVLEARVGYSFANRDVYISVAGGLRITEPACDLAAAVALISAYDDVPLPQKTVFFGEVGLSGDMRPVGHEDLRLKEALKLGFSKAYVPVGFQSRHPKSPKESSHELEHISDTVSFISINSRTSKKNNKQ